MSLNGKGLGDVQKVKKLLGFLRDKKANMAFISESHLTEERADTIRSGFPGLGAITNTPFHNRVGVTWLVLDTKRIPLEQVTLIENDDKGRRLGIRCRIENASKPTRLMGIYVPNQETAQVDFLLETAERIRELKKIDIVLGDWNCTMDYEDRNPTRKEDLRVENALHTVTATVGYLDRWRETQGPTRRYTYHTPDFSSSSRINRILVQLKAFQISDCWYIVDTPEWTEHSAVYVQYCPHTKVEIGRGQWYMVLDYDFYQSRL